MVEDIESITKSITRLLDAAEVSLMAEGGAAVPFNLGLDLSTPYAVEKDSTVENRLDVGVIPVDSCSSTSPSKERGSIGGKG